MIKHHRLDLLYLNMNTDRWSRFFTIYHFLLKPVIFKTVLQRDRGFDALHSGTFYTPNIQPPGNFLAFIGNTKLRNFILHANIILYTLHGQKNHEFGPFSRFLRTTPTLHFRLGGGKLCSAPLEEHQHF